MAQYDQTEQMYTLIQVISRKLRNPKLETPDANLSTSTTRVQLLVLKTLLEQKQCTHGYLANTIGVRPSTMSQMLGRLEKAGLVARFADIADARVRIIRLTDKGENIFHRSESEFIRNLAGPLKGLTPEERQTLIRLMEKLTAHFPRQNHY